jgi:adenylate cyclase
MGAPKFTQVMKASLLKPDLMAELDKFRRDITVLFTDIRGSTAYFEKHGDIMGVMMVHQCTEVLRGQIEKQAGGKFIKTIGDAVMATFEDATAAVQCAVNMQKALKEHNATRLASDPICIRIGLNYGPGIVKTDDVFGDVVNVASRVESVAQADQVIISATVNQKITGAPFQINYLGKFALKGKEGPSDLFEVVWDENKGVKPKPLTSHTIMAAGAGGFQLPTFKLQHMVPGGATQEWAVKSKPVIIGQASGEIVFSNDSRMAPQHALLTANTGQLCVEDLSDRGIFVRLVATHTLQNRDVILVGTQMMKFMERSEELAAAAHTGTALMNLAAALDAPPAEFIGIRPDGSETGARYPLKQEEVTFGRSGTTYVFEKDEFMSRTHCKVYHRGENFFIEDCSRNGTYLKVQGKAPVPPGSSLIVGSQLFRVSQQ